MRASEVVGSVRAMFKRDVQPKAPVAIDALIEEVAGPRRRASCEGAAIALEVKLAPGLPRVLADRVQLQQVFLNLIANAIDAMRGEQDRARRLRVRAGAGEAQQRVDRRRGFAGPASPPATASASSMPFFTTKASGMGLGLAICRSIVEAHGGRLAVAAATPRGTIFELTLPTGEAGER